MSSTWLFSGLTGGLVGSALADLDGSCPGVQDCASPLMQDAGAYSGGRYVEQPGAAVPVPAPLVLIASGMAALLGLRLVRRATGTLPG